VGYLAYQLGLLQLLYFLDDKVLFLLRLLPGLLLHGVCLRAMGNQLAITRWSPRAA
jgi:hypothetical protein